MMTEIKKENRQEIEKIKRRIKNNIKDKDDNLPILFVKY